MRQFVLVVCIIFGLSFVSTVQAQDSFGLPLVDPEYKYRFEDISPNSSFTAPIDMQHHDDWWFVLERGGTVKLLPSNSPKVAAKKLFKLNSEGIRSRGEEGAVGLAVHPNFSVASKTGYGQVFVYYTAFVSSVIYYRVSRFTIDMDQFNAGELPVKYKEEVLIDQKKDTPIHNGGAIRFGPDGFLYLGIGDEGSSSDSSKNSQRIDRDLFSGILRIDVDCDPIRSKPTDRQPLSGKTQGYCIPNDNPFVNEIGALKEFWSIGLRNPFRMEFAGVSKDLWVADVGEAKFEEVNIARRGSNHQWSYLEGESVFTNSYLKGRKPYPYFGSETSPVYSLDRSVATAIIGGFLYQGSSMPPLRGKYLFGDLPSGRLYSVHGYPDDSMSLELLNRSDDTGQFGLTSIVEGPDGEPYITFMGSQRDNTRGKLYRLVGTSENEVTEFPKLLSQSSLFADLANLKVDKRLLRYKPRFPMREQGAVVTYWVGHPKFFSGEKFAIDVPTADFLPWKLPRGSVLVRHLQIERSKDELVHLETQVLVVTGEDGVIGRSYKWNKNQTDAELISHSAIYQFPRDTFATVKKWNFAGPDNCYSCHSKGLGILRGVNTAQLGDPTSSFEVDDWDKLGVMFYPENKQVGFKVHTPTMSNEETKVKVLLSQSCSSCHSLKGSQADVALDFINLSPAQHLVGKTSRSHFPQRIVFGGRASSSMLFRRVKEGFEGVRMPPNEHYYWSQRELDVLSEWIESTGSRSYAWDVEILRRPIQDGMEIRFKVDDINFHSYDSGNFLKGIARQLYSMTAKTCFELAEKTQIKFSSGADDNASVLLDGNYIIEDPSGHPFTLLESTRMVGKGLHELVVEYHQGSGAAVLQFDATKQSDGTPLEMQPCN